MFKNYYITHTGEGGSTQYTVYDDYFMNRSDLKPHQQMHKERSPSNFHIYDIAVYSKSDSVYHDLSVYNKRDYISHHTNAIYVIFVLQTVLA